jgi:hypothetical protein
VQSGENTQFVAALFEQFASWPRTSRPISRHHPRVRFAAIERKAMVKTYSAPAAMSKHERDDVEAQNDNHGCGPHYSFVLA